jgi:hypothetical protein
MEELRQIDVHNFPAAINTFSSRKPLINDLRLKKKKELGGEF